MVQKFLQTTYSHAWVNKDPHQYYDFDDMISSFFESKIPKIDVESLHLLEKNIIKLLAL